MEVCEFLGLSGESWRYGTAICAATREYDRGICVSPYVGYKTMLCVADFTPRLRKML
jgi:hypothetical protein